MVRFLISLFCLLMLWGCSGELRFGNRPTDASEGVPGYIIKPGQIVFDRTSSPLQVRGPAASVEGAEGRSASELVASIYGVDSEELSRLQRSPLQLTAHQGQFLGSSPVLEDGSFAVSVSGTVESPILIVAVSDRVTPNHILIGNRSHTHPSAVFDDGSGPRALFRDGTTRTMGNFGVTSASAERVRRLSNGQLMISGRSNPGTGTNGFLLRMNGDGNPDTSFGNQGMLQVDLGGDGAEMLYDVVELSDGSLLAGGSGRVPAGTNDDFAVAKFSAQGVLDGSFGSGGIFKADFNGANDWVQSIHPLETGQFLLAGASGGVGSSHDFLVIRLTSLGTADGSFGLGGEARLDFDGSSDIPRRMVVDSQGRIVLAGRTALNGSNRWGVVRFLSDGSLDLSFGTQGRVVMEFGEGTDAAQSILLLEGDELFVGGGVSVNGVTQSVVAKLSSSGALDSSFGDGGILSLNQSVPNSCGELLTVGEQFMCVGYLEGIHTGRDYLAFRFSSQGVLDSGFGISGLMVSDFSGQLDQATDALFIDGNLFSVGIANGQVGFWQF